MAALSGADAAAALASAQPKKALETCRLQLPHRRLPRLHRQPAVAVACSSPIRASPTVGRRTQTSISSSLSPALSSFSPSSSSLSSSSLSLPMSTASLPPLSLLPSPPPPPPLLASLPTFSTTPPWSSQRRPTRAPPARRWRRWPTTMTSAACRQLGPLARVVSHTLIVVAAVAATGVFVVQLTGSDGGVGVSALEVWIRRPPRTTTSLPATPSAELHRGRPWRGGAGRPPPRPALAVIAFGTLDRARRRRVDSPPPPPPSSSSPMLASSTGTVGWNRRVTGVFATERVDGKDTVTLTLTPDLPTAADVASLVGGRLPAERASRQDAPAAAAAAAPSTVAIAATGVRGDAGGHRERPPNGEDRPLVQQYVSRVGSQEAAGAAVVTAGSTFSSTGGSSSDEHARTPGTCFDCAAGLSAANASSIGQPSAPVRRPPLTDAPLRISLRTPPLSTPFSLTSLTTTSLTTTTPLSITMTTMKEPTPSTAMSKFLVGLTGRPTLNMPLTGPALPKSPPGRLSTSLSLLAADKGDNAEGVSPDVVVPADRVLLLASGGCGGFRQGYSTFSRTQGKRAPDDEPHGGSAALRQAPCLVDEEVRAGESYRGEATPQDGRDQPAPSRFRKAETWEAMALGGAFAGDQHSMSSRRAATSDAGSSKINGLSVVVGSASSANRVTASHRRRVGLRPGYDQASDYSQPDLFVDLNAGRRNSSSFDDDAGAVDDSRHNGSMADSTDYHAADTGQAEMSGDDKLVGSNRGNSISEMRNDAFSETLSMSPAASQAPDATNASAERVGTPNGGASLPPTPASIDLPAASTSLPLLPPLLPGASSAVKSSRLSGGVTGRAAAECGWRPLHERKPSAAVTPYDGEDRLHLNRVKRIVGGSPAAEGQWPWQVIIKEVKYLGAIADYKCGGVLISSRHVLTAAHCRPRGFLSTLVVILGKHRMHEKDLQTVPVTRMIVHKGFNEADFDNDLALLELQHAVGFNDKVVPICLPDVDENFVGLDGYVTGWGKLAHKGGLPRMLQNVRLPIIPREKCQRMFMKSGHVKAIHEHFLCAGYDEGRLDACEGDSGGPLSVQRTNGQWVLAGTVSHGIRCAEPNLPGIYMNISRYRAWIDRMMALPRSLSILTGCLNLRIECFEDYDIQNFD